MHSYVVGWAHMLLDAYFMNFDVAIKSDVLQCSIQVHFNAPFCTEKFHVLIYAHSYASPYF